MRTSAAILGLSIAASVHAQQNPNPESPSSPAALEDIVVTAEKRSESLEKVPLSIVAYSAQALAETGVEPIGKIVIGTVKGDIHDIGKNLVSMIDRKSVV